MLETTLVISNAILFILDPTNDAAVVPEYIPGETATATPSCVSVATLADVDGEVTVRLDPLSENAARPSSVQVFAGLVQTPGHVLAVVTSELERVLEVATASVVTRIAIYVDDVQSAAEVTVAVGRR